MSRLQMIAGMLHDDPHDPFLVYALALEYQKINDLPKAVSLLEDLHTKNAAYLPLYYTLGKMYEARGDAAKAISVYKAGIGIARQQQDNKTLGELNEAVFLLDDDDE